MLQARLAETDIVEANIRIQEELYYQAAADTEYYAHAINTRGLFELAVADMTVHDDGLFYVTYDNVLPAVRAEYARVGLDDAAITDDDIMAVMTDTLTWMLYHEYEEYIPETPWEWSEFAIDYHITSHMAHALTWPLGIWAEDIIGFANDDFDYYTYSQGVYNMLVLNL